MNNSKESRFLLKVLFSNKIFTVVIAGIVLYVIVLYYGTRRNALLDTGLAFMFYLLAIFTLPSIISSIIVYCFLPRWNSILFLSIGTFLLGIILYTVHFQGTGVVCVITAGGDLLLCLSTYLIKH